MITFIYVILVFLILRFSVTLFNFISNPKLGRYGKHFSSTVSIQIAPATDEVCMLSLLHSLKIQDYEQIEVVIQRGRDNEDMQTITNFCAGDDRFMIAEGLGKNPAEPINGEYLLFLDPYTTIKNGFINSLIYRTKVFDLALLSIIPCQTAKTFLEKCLVPLDDFVLLNLIPLRLVRLAANPAFAVASDKCLFFDAAMYRTYQWPAGKESVKAVKMENQRAETLLGDRLISIFPPQPEINLLNSCGKSLLLNFGNNGIAAFLYLILVVAGPIIMVLNYEYALLIMPVGLIFLTRIMISFLARQNPLTNLILHPIQMIMLFVALTKAIFARILTFSRR